MAVAADRVVGGADVLAWLQLHDALARTAFQLGVVERALELTALYAREREQFDRYIGSFQAVTSRLADGYIDVKALRLTLTQASWRVAEGLPAEVDVNTAAFWAAEAGHRWRTAVRARWCRHRHGSSCAPVLPGWPPSRPSSRSAVPPGQLLQIGRQNSRRRAPSRFD